MMLEHDATLGTLLQALRGGWRIAGHFETPTRAYWALRSGGAWRYLAIPPEWVVPS